MLKLTRVTRAHMGPYLCIASNGVPPAVSKRIVLNVYCTYLEYAYVFSVTRLLVENNVYIQIINEEFFTFYANSLKNFDDLKICGWIVKSDISCSLKTCCSSDKRMSYLMLVKDFLDRVKSVTEINDNFTMFYEIL